MNFALLGIDETIEPLAASLVAEGHHLAAAFELAGPARQSFQARFPDVRLGESWDELLTLDQATPILVARGEDQDLRAEQLRKLIQQAQPLVIAHPVLDSMVVYFELEMIRKDAGGIVLPWVSDRWHPGFVRIKEILREGELGRIEQLVIERTMRRPTRENLRTRYVCDMHLARAWLEDFTKVGAMASTAGKSASLSVQMSSPTGILARWSAIGGGDRELARMTLVGARGQVAIELSDASTPWRLALHLPVGDRGELIDADRRTGLELASHIVGLTRGEPSPPTWLDACREVELADAVDRSAAKGKTIELYLEEVNEQNTFKGMMAAGGCFLLVAALAVVVVAAMLAGLEVPFARFWPYALLLLLGGFLLLQLLRLAFPAERS